MRNPDHHFSWIGMGWLIIHIKRQRQSKCVVTASPPPPPPPPPIPTLHKTQSKNIPTYCCISSATSTCGIGGCGCWGCRWCAGGFCHCPCGPGGTSCWWWCHGCCRRWRAYGWPGAWCSCLQLRRFCRFRWPYIIPHLGLGSQLCRK